MQLDSMRVITVSKGNGPARRESKGPQKPETSPLPFAELLPWEL